MNDTAAQSPSAAAVEAGGVLQNLSEADAGAVLESLSAAGADGGSGGAGAGSAADSALAGLGSLDDALAGADLTQMTEAQLRDFESGDPYRVEAALAAVQQPHAAHPAPGGEEDEDADATTTGAAAAASTSALAPSRISIKALKPEDRARTVQALDLIRAGHSPAAAFAQVFGHPDASAEGEAPGTDFHEADAAYTDAAYTDASAYADPHAPQPQSTAPQVAGLEQHLSHLQQQYRLAKDTYDPAATDLLEQITDVKMDLREAQREAAVLGRAWQGRQAESHARAMQMYAPLIADDGCGFVSHCDDEILLAEAKSDPILNHPDWPEKIGRRVLDKFFAGAAAHSPGHAEGASLIPPAPRHTLRLPGSPVGPGFSAGALSPQTAMAEIDKLTPEQQDAFIHSLDRLTTAKARR